MIDKHYFGKNDIHSRTRDQHVKWPSGIMENDNIMSTKKAVAATASHGRVLRRKANVTKFMF